MIELYYGNNEFLLADAWKKRRQEFIDEYGKSAVTLVDASESDWPKLHQALSGMSLFDDGESMVIIRSISENKELANRLAEELEHISDSTQVLVVEPSIDKRSKLFKDVKREGLVHEYSDLNETELASWAVQYVKDKNGSLSRSDAALLVDMVGTDQLMLQSELEKLVLHGSQINKEAIEELVERRPEDSVFVLLDAMTAGQVEKAGALYKELRQAQAAPIYILTMIAWQLHLLAAVHAAGNRGEREIASAIKASPYAVGKSMRIARRISAADMRAIIELAATRDLEIKQGRVDADQGVEGLVLAIAQLASK